MSGIVEHELTSIAFCWRLQRRDGVCLGFTTHDRDLWVGGLRYRAAPGMLPSAIARSDGFDADTLEIEGALTSSAITPGDLAAGRWDGASVTIFMADWTAPEDEALLLARGTLGDVGMAGNRFTAGLDGPTAALDRPVVEQTSPECRAELGDKRCRVDMAARTHICRIVDVVADDVLAVDWPEAGAGACRYGRLRWISGANSSIEGAIFSSDGARLTLRDPPPFPAAAGDLIEIVEGCDKRFETCRDRFANAVNFRGEPHLPGIDLLTRYGAA